MVFDSRIAYLLSWGYFSVSVFTFLIWDTVHAGTSGLVLLVPSCALIDRWALESKHNCAGTTSGDRDRSVGMYGRNPHADNQGIAHRMLSFWWLEMCCEKGEILYLEATWDRKKDREVWSSAHFSQAQAPVFTVDRLARMPGALICLWNNWKLTG